MVKFISHSEIEDFINLMPKSELHLHFEGMVTPLILQKLIKKYEPENPLTESLRGIQNIYNFNSFPMFLNAFSFMYSFIRSPNDYEVIFNNVIDQYKNKNYKYIEFYLSPDILYKKGFTLEEILNILRQISKKSPYL